MWNVNLVDWVDRNDNVMSTVSLVAATTGVLSHLLYFIRGEHHKNALFLFILSIWLPPLSSLVLVQFLESSFSHAAQLTASFTAAYLGALWTSMIIYRAFFHRLNHFPGPPLAKTSKLYHCFKLSKMDNFRKLTRWHEEYGDFVRIGPGELSIISPNAAHAILGPGSRCLKSPWYDNGTVSLQFIRDLKEHASRRRVWDRAFSAKALRDYEGRVIRYTEELIKQLSANSDHPINASIWFNYYSFDVMGDLAFGKSFDMLKTGRPHHFMSVMADGIRLLGVLNPLTWVIPIFAATPILGADYRELLRWSGEQADQRKKMKIDVPDITSWLFPDDETNKKWLHGDARLIVVAGSDTTAAALTFVFYYLASDPRLVERLREELKTLLPLNGPFQVKNVEHAALLNGIIIETLRMHPPVPSGTSRITPEEGIIIDGVFVPGQTNVIVPHYALGRSEKCYALPNEFIPERWFSRPELIKSKNAFAAFSLGPWGCIGKQLALMELRTVVSLLITRFDISFAPGDDGSSLMENTLDTFTVRLGDLNLVFSERRSKKADRAGK